MSKFFTIATDPLSAEEEKKVKELFVPGTIWWHWLPNFWLVKDNADHLNASNLISSIKSINSTARAVVLEVDPVTWSALTRPNAQGKNMSAWITSNWKRS